MPVFPKILGVKGHEGICMCGSGYSNMVVNKSFIV